MSGTRAKLLSNTFFSTPSATSATELAPEQGP